MRWAFRFGLLLLVAWAAFLVSPFLALRGLAQAVEERDSAAIAERVHLPALRASLVEQIADEYLRQTGQEPDPSRRRLAAAAAAGLAEPLAAQLVTPQALIDLFEDGWPEAVAGLRPAGFAARRTPDWVSLEAAGRLFGASETRGFRKIYIAVPPDRPAEERFRLYLRLKGTTWRLMSVQLPPALRQRLARDLPKPNA